MVTSAIELLVQPGLASGLLALILLVAVERPGA
jgi:hypothetical protein